METTVVLEGVKASELPEAWRRRVNAKAGEVLTVTIAKHKAPRKAAKKPNATFGMWADREDVADPAAYVRALRQPRTPRAPSVRSPRPSTPSSSARS
jgi:hypothetical protein